jgi:phenylalanyl-tRNA synthetase alpha subunit
MCRASSAAARGAGLHGEGWFRFWRGMVNPRVLGFCGIDASVNYGFAFGIGA